MQSYQIVANRVSRANLTKNSTISYDSAIVVIVVVIVIVWTGYYGMGYCLPAICWLHIYKDIDKRLKRHLGELCLIGTTCSFIPIIRMRVPKLQNHYILGIHGYGDPRDQILNKFCLKNWRHACKHSKQGRYVLWNEIIRPVAAVCVG